MFHTILPRRCDCVASFTEETFSPDPVDSNAKPMAPTCAQWYHSNGLALAPRVVWVRDQRPYARGVAAQLTIIVYRKRRRLPTFPSLCSQLLCTTLGFTCLLLVLWCFGSGSGTRDLTREACQCRDVHLCCRSFLSTLLLTPELYGQTS